MSAGEGTRRRVAARLAAGALASALAVVAGWWWLAPSDPVPPVQDKGAPVGRATGFSVMAAGSGGHAASAAVEAPLAQIERRVFERGSLRGTTPDGDWALDAQGQLRPGLGLRRRFDYYLSAHGEVSVDDIGRLMLQQAARELAPEAVAQIKTVWERYLALQRYGFTQQVQLDDRSAWSAALAERQRVRRQILGPAWAEAFYREEEEALARHITGEAAAQVSALLPDPRRLDAATLHQQRVAQFGPEAAERLRQEDEAWAQWQRRLLRAHAEIEALRRAPELSQPQRDAAIERYLQEHFDAAERMRVLALMAAR
ncbi:lipase secretion chaperone [Caldimonas brevitalea]|uniref:Lipase helper protein n=1 Tax=Caldimonas brevitalea TaxID=413882 RepID=A0A0G3BFT1_9BURK|nr:lipase secretion chaperone [Caldimonas brevitalea]AKJ26803.1 lipase modulator protein [Caldimonas brevitalea]